MTRTNRRWAIPMLAVVLFAIGCSTEGTPTSTPGQSTLPAETTAARPTLTDSKLQPPSQNNQYTQSSGRPKIVFDPCTWISDETILRAGFEPGSRKRGKDLVAEYSFFICQFDALAKDLTVYSGNATWEENIAKVGSYSEPTNINGREALLVRNPGMRRGCQVDVRTEVGFVQIAVDLTDRSPAGTDPCAGITDIASTIEPEIGKDN
ncbi:DUF3558 domain-containing protein [Nocardia puris]|uniref:Uncharacterized protein DUF3558 n=1 Tax=Nocardia puris TaxID=208602 RepID=A0A366DYC3_9NOCA|nr:DUF3558 domain-containing protein [Nocardia puris]MBF6209990.1 DUF3558 domain-containing protein [Nocardia puris]MBF6368181.1 DUF3558 domain-containing protein [Nocardia puris]MBF6458100.1 DUF3558 domain-containing protein [Nocardia puris]RBO94264.1 uncharacterized protein DUF3558 [Nocardia puris]